MATSYTNAAGQVLYTSQGILKEYAATAAGQTITGPGGAEQLKDVAGGDTLIGGIGDDTFLVVDSSTKIVEQPNGGTDSVIAWTNYTLPANVENLTISSSYDTGVGNSGNNILTATTTNVRLVGGGGNDVFINTGGGNSTFVFAPGSSGQDAIIGFHATGANHDFISVGAGYGISSFADIQSHLTQQGADTLLTLSSSDSVLIRNTVASSLTVSDFLLPLNTSGMTTTFDDEFNGLSLYNSATGQGTWKTNFSFGIQAEQGSNSWASRTLTGNAEQEIYVDPSYAGNGTTALGLNPFSVSNGVLTITANKTPSQDLAALNGYQYTSGILTTQKSFSQTYGYFEMRAELPTGKGVWPAFWLVPANGSGPAELDVMEAVGGNAVYSTTHTGQTGSPTTTEFETTLSNLSNTYHTYGLLWTATEIDYYVDGQEIGSMATPADMHQAMYMEVNLAIGGNWPGNPTANFTSAQMNIDYIRAYSLPSTIASTTSTSTTTTPLVETVHTATSSTDTTLNGADSVLSSFTYSLVSTTAHALTLLGSASINATGNDLGDIITGNAGADHLAGGAGADSIVAGAGIDTMTGGAGNDTYVINNSGDVIVEAANGGADVVYSSVSYALPANVEHLILTGSSALTATGGVGGVWISGNSGNDTITGGAGGANFLHAGTGNDLLQGSVGSDTLQDGAGLDTLVGGSGADTYFISNSATTIVEQAGGGADVVYSTVTYKLSDNVEQLILQGTANIDGYAGSTGATITGNSGADHLYGGIGNDSLVAGSGIDTIAGGAGNDTYVINNSSDVIVEAANAGTDVVYSSVNYTLPANVEHMILTGSSNITGTGGDGGVWISGNNGNDTLVGGAGNDYLHGGNGADVIRGGAGNDTLTGGAGDDTFIFSPSGGGKDVVTDFDGQGDHDVVDISAYLSAGYTPHLQDVSAGVLITFAGLTDVIQLSGIHIASLSATAMGWHG